MSYSVVTTWSHKEALHRDRFMFAKKSSESFFHCIQSHPSMRSRVSQLVNARGWFTLHCLPSRPLDGKAVVAAAVAAGGAAQV